MAPNRRLESEERVSSSEEDEGLFEEHEEQDESESESDEDEEEEEAHKISPKTPSIDKNPVSASKKKSETVQTSSTGDDDESDSRSESDSESGDLMLRDRSIKSDHNVKPIASKRMKEAPDPKSSENSRSKSRIGVKRASGNEINGTELKKAKTTKAGSDDGGEIGGKPKQLFQRLWTEDGEIAVLEGLIEYRAIKGGAIVSLADMSAFYEFIKNKLQIVVSKNQLSDKVRRLRDKYKNNPKRGKKGRYFSKDHEQKCYELSQKVWGIESPKANNGEAAKSGSDLGKLGVVSSSPSPSPSVVAGSSWLGKIIGDDYLSLGEEILNDGIELIDEGKRMELEEKSKKLRVEEVEVYLKRLELIRDQTKLVLDALKSSLNN